MKKYIKPQAEIMDVQLSEYCETAGASSYEVELPSEDASQGGMQQGGGLDDL